MSKNLDAREKYSETRKGNLTTFAGMVGEEFASKVHRLSQVIKDVHEVSIGDYKESLLRKCLKEYLPKKYCVGRGFILFSDKDDESILTSTDVVSIDRLNLKKHFASAQQDIIVYDSHNYAPVFQDDDFVVVVPDSVSSVIEVKGYLTRKNIKETVKKYVLLGRQWNRYREYVQSQRREELGKISMFFMAFDKYINTDGRVDCDAGQLRKSLVEAYKENLDTSKIDVNEFPLIISAYIYNDCEVDLTGYFEKDSEALSHAYSTNRGKLVRYGKDGAPMLAGESTIANLISAIKSRLQVPYMSDYTHLTQTYSTEVFPHEFQGMTDIVTGEDVDLSKIY